MEDVQKYYRGIWSPVSSECHTKDIGMHDFSVCMVAQPNHCHYAVLFGNEVFCSHPKHAEYRTPEPELS
jgi:hypothetical protein